MLGSIHDFDPTKDRVADLLDIDRWAVSQLQALVGRVTQHYEDYAFFRAYQDLYQFCVVELSSIYFDVLKDRLYTAAPDSPARRSAQTALYRLAHALVRLLAPLASFTCEEVWGCLPKLPGDPSSVHLALFPAPEDLTAGINEHQRKRLANWDRLMEMRPMVLKALEQARQEKFIGNALEARVRLSANSELGPLLADYAQDLPMLFIVSQVALESGGDGLQVKVERADGTKCERCWKYTTDVGSDTKWPTICGPCARAVEEIERGQ